MLFLRKTKPLKLLFGCLLALFYLPFVQASEQPVDLLQVIKGGHIKKYEKCLKEAGEGFFKKRYEDQRTIFHLLAEHDRSGDLSRKTFDLGHKVKLPLNAKRKSNGYHMLHSAVEMDNLFFITELVRFRNVDKTNVLRVNTKDLAKHTPDKVAPKKAVYGKAIVELLKTLGLKG